MQCAVQVLLPLDVTAQFGVVQQDMLKGQCSEELRTAVHHMASTAYAHLNTGSAALAFSPHQRVSQRWTCSRPCRAQPDPSSYHMHASNVIAVSHNSASGVCAALSGRAATARLQSVRQGAPVPRRPRTPPPLDGSAEAVVSFCCAQCACEARCEVVDMQRKSPKNLGQIVAAAIIRAPGTRAALPARRPHRPALCLMQRCLRSGMCSLRPGARARSDTGFGGCALAAPLPPARFVSRTVADCAQQAWRASRRTLGTRPRRCCSRHVAPACAAVAFAAALRH